MVIALALLWVVVAFSLSHGGRCFLGCSCSSVLWCWFPLLVWVVWVCCFSCVGVLLSRPPSVGWCSRSPCVTLDAMNYYNVTESHEVKLNQIWKKRGGVPCLSPLGGCSCFFVVVTLVMGALQKKEIKNMNSNKNIQN